MTSITQSLFKRLTIPHILIISMVVHFLAGLNSTGFHHFDEHFQIIEFLNVKTNPKVLPDLAWEYEAMIRPWFQVYLYYLIMKFLGLFNINDHVLLVDIFRITTAMFGFYCFYRFQNSMKHFFKSDMAFKLMVFFLHLTWFIPYIQARHSSESLGLDFFVLGLSFYFDINTKNKNRDKFLAGLLMATAYLCRSQIAVMVATFWFWSIYNDRKIDLKFILFSLGIATAILVGPIFDYWGYGKWTFVPYNYYFQNIVKGVLENNGVSPWYFYIKEIFTKSIPSLGLIVLLVFTLFSVLNPKHFITAIILPFFFFHMALGHKELRFLFPLAPFFAVALALFIDQFKYDLHYWYENKKWLKIFLNFSFGLNLFLLIAVCFRPTNASHLFYGYVWNHPEIKEIIAVEKDPYEFIDLKMNFFKPDYLKLNIFPYYNDSAVDKITGEKFILFQNTRDGLYFKEKRKCETMYSTYPDWVVNFDIGHWVGRTRAWMLLKCR